MAGFKNGKIMLPIKEFLIVKEQSSYELNMIDMSKVTIFYRKYNKQAFLETYQVMPKGDYRVNEVGGNKKLEITNLDILNEYYSIQLCRVVDLKASPYNPSGEIDVITLNQHLNEVVSDITFLFTYLKDVGMVMDSSGGNKILAELKPFTTWFMDENGNMAAMPVNSLFDGFNQLVESLRKEISVLLQEDYQKLSNLLTTETNKHIQTLKDKLDELLIQSKQQLDEYTLQKIEEIKNACEQLLTLKYKLFKADTIEQLKTMTFLQVGEVVEVLGYYSKDDGATHKRVIAQDDDGSGVQLANQLWANIIYNGEVNVSWFGAKGDGVTDDAVIFEKVLAFTKTKNMFIKILMDSKTYKLTSGLEVDVSKSTLVGNKSVMDFTNQLEGVSILVYSSKYPPYGNNVIYFQGFTISGNRDIDGILISNKEEMSSGASRVNFRNICITEYNRGLVMGNNCYANYFECLEIYRCNVCFDAPKSIDSGERVVMTNSTLYNSKLCFRTNHSDGSFHFTNCSFDYSDKFFELSGRSHTFLTDCHIETRPSMVKQNLITLVDIDTLFSVNGGFIIYSGNGQVDYAFIKNDATKAGGVKINNVVLHNILSEKFVDGAGVCQINNNNTFSLSALPTYVASWLNKARILDNDVAMFDYELTNESAKISFSNKNDSIVLEKVKDGSNILSLYFHVPNTNYQVFSGNVTLEVDSSKDIWLSVGMCDKAGSRYPITGRQGAVNLKDYPLKQEFNFAQRIHEGVKRGDYLYLSFNLNFLNTGEKIILKNFFVGGY